VFPGTKIGRLLISRKGKAGRFFAAALVVAMGVAQYSASWHEASVRHVRCAEHGEAIDVGAFADPGTSPARHRAAGTGIESADSTETPSHHHCAIVLACRASARAQLVRTAMPLLPPPVVVRPVGEPVSRPGCVFVLASAPKTSPPVG